MIRSRGHEGADHASSPTPRARLFTEHVVVERGDLLGSELEELEVPVLQLSFDYPEGRVQASDASDRFFAARGAVMEAHQRDHEAEAQARQTLESFGAVDLQCVEHYGLPPGSEADYLVRAEEDVHERCAFTAHAVPRLRALGWHVEIDPDYPYQVVEEEVSWYGALDEDDTQTDWFSLELGVEIEGRRINLVPVFLELLADHDGSTSFESLARRSRRMFAVPIDDNCYLRVPPERVRSLLQVVIELYEGGRSHGRTLEFPGMQASALARLELAFDDGGFQWRGDTNVVQRGKALHDAPAPDSGADAPTAERSLDATLRPYQRNGVAWLQHLRRCGVGGVLADDMGLGKTLQTLAHIALERESGRADNPCLVVAPTSLVGTWAREVERFASHLRAVVYHGTRRHERWAEVPECDVVITNYPLIVRDRDRLQTQPFHLVVLDEAHTIKNARSQAHRAVQGLQAEHRICLTGTPIENHLGELWSIFDFLNPGLLGDYPTFRSGYQSPIEQDRDDRRLGALQQHVAPYILRRTKREVVQELPPKTELSQPVTLTGPQRELYESIRVAAHADVRRAICKAGLAQSTVPILDALMKLRQVCCDPRLLDMEAARSVTRSAKFDRLMELVPEQVGQGHRILLFSQFTSMLALIAHGLEEQHIPYVTLTGSTRDRQARVDAFERGDADVFLISLKAGGTGLNLTSADTVIHYDPWWNPAAQTQATDRAYRIGQTRPVFVHNLFAAGSVEERMIALQRRKQRLSDAILGGHATFTEEDVDVLFAPLDSA